MSAQVLGQKVGLNAQEFNHALKEAGLLSGGPGAYAVTDKGAKFAAGQFHQRGTGGYAHMNPSWETTTWDDAVLGVLDLSDDAKRRIQQAVSDMRKARQAARAVRSQAVAIADISRNDVVGARGGYALTKAGGTLLAGVAAYGIFKAIPLVQNLRNGKAAPGLKDRVPPKPDAGEEAGTDELTT